MKINTNPNQKQIFIAVILLVLAALLMVIVLEKTRTTDFIKDPTYHEILQGPTQEQIKQQEQEQADQKSEFLDKNSQEGTTQPAEVPTDSETIHLTLTQEGESVTVRNELHGQGYSSGTCKLTVTNGSKTTVQEAQIIYQPEYSMCAGFSVPVSPSGTGNWSISLEVTPLNGQALTKTATIEVRS